MSTMPDMMMPESQAPVSFQEPEMQAPERPSVAIIIEPSDREKLERAYGDEILRALSARRSMAGGNQWAANPAGTSATNEGPSSITIPSFEEQIKDYWDRYELVPPDRDLPFDGASNYRVPITKWEVDAIHGRLMSGLTGVRPYHRVEPRDSIRDVEPAAKREAFLDYVMEQKIRFKEWLDDALLNAEVEGTAIGYVTWEERREHRFVQIVEETQQDIFDTQGVAGIPGAFLGTKQVPVTRIEERDEVVYRGPRLDLVPILDFLVADPRRKELDSQPWCGHRTRLYRPELEALRGQEGYYDDAINWVLQTRGGSTAEGGQHILDSSLESRTGIRVTDTANLAMLDWFEVWPLLAWYDWDRDGRPERVILEIVMPEKKLIRLIKFPYLHSRANYIPIRLLPRSNFFYGRSLAQDMAMTQDELDAIHNMRTDATAIAIASQFMFLYDEQAGFDPGRGKIALGEHIRVEGDMQHIQSLAKAFKGVEVPGADIENMLMGFAERLSGISDPQAGRPSEGRKTAFEIGAVIQEGNVRFRRMIERVELPLAELASQVMDLYSQYADPSEPEVFRVLNDPSNPFRTMEQGELEGRYNYRVHGVSVASNQDIDARKAMDMLDRVDSSPMLQMFLQQDPLRAWEMMKTIMDKIGWVGAEKYIGSREQLIKALQMAAAQQQPTQQPTDGGEQVSPGVEETVQRLLGEGGGGAPQPPAPGESPGGSAIGVQA